MPTGRDRVRDSLRGLAVQPPATGLTFVPPAALSAEDVERQDPALVLTEACTNAELDFAFVPSWEPWAPRALALLARADVACLWVVRGVLWPTLEGLGVSEGLKATASDPGSLRPLLDEAAAVARQETEHGLALGADAVVVAEDLAGATGPLVSPDFALAEVLPRLAGVTALARADGTAAVLHCDGDVRVLLSAVAIAGFDAVHAGGIDADAFERLFWQARTDGLAVLGGIDVAGYDRGLPAAVRAGTRAGILAAAGGLLVADDGGVASHHQFAAVLAALAAARD
jgi:hypothetical protein